MFVGNIMFESLLYQNSLSLQSFRCIALFTLSRSIAQILFHMVCIMVEQGFHGDGSVFLEWQKNNAKILTEFSKKSHDFSTRLMFIKVRSHNFCHRGFLNQWSFEIFYCFLRNVAFSFFSADISEIKKVRQII